MIKRLILASASPRRRELLGLLNLPFEVIASDAEERFDSSYPPSEIAGSLARQKAEAVAIQLSCSRPEGELIVIGADTLVALEHDGVREILGKPRDSEDARRMLRMLSGVAHEVYTGISLTIVGAALESESQ